MIGHFFPDSRFFPVVRPLLSYSWELELRESKAKPFAQVGDTAEVHLQVIFFIDPGKFFQITPG
jgi:hypothetical protein